MLYLIKKTRKKWIDDELHGYKGTIGEVQKISPEYRKVHLDYRDNYGRPIVFSGNMAFLHDDIVVQSVAEIESASDLGLTLVGGPYIETLRQQGYEVNVAHILNFYLKNIIEQVKNRALEFANGIVKEYVDLQKPTRKADASEKPFIFSEQTEIARSLLYELENKLRMFVASKIETDRKRIDDSVLKSWEGSNKKEHLPPRKPLELDLINYSNFEHLRKIITQNENWSQIFQKYFGRPEGIISRINELDSIRDTLAHNRMISDFDFRSFKTLYDQIIRCIEE